MRATLLQTDNEEAIDLVGETDTFSTLEDGVYEFSDLVFDCRSKTSTTGNELCIVSGIGYTYTFKIVEEA